MPENIRRLITVESGLNDGIATPVVMVAIAEAASAEGIANAPGLGQSVAELAIGAIVGAAVGLLGGWILRVARRRGSAEKDFVGIAVVVLALAAYAAAVVLHGNGFVPAFCAGLAFGAAAGRRAPAELVLLEQVSSLLSLLVWLAFGAIAIPIMIGSLNLATVLYAVASLTVVRMVPVALATIGSGLDRTSVLFVGWFGPSRPRTTDAVVQQLRGFASSTPAQHQTQEKTHVCHNCPARHPPPRANVPRGPVPHCRCPPCHRLHGLFGAWRAILAPWIALPDGADHGWRRTAELHVPADAASGVLMMGVGIAAVLLVIRPLRRSVLMVWMIQTLVILSVGVATSTLLQGQAGPMGAMMSGGTMLLVVVPLVLLHPERRAVLAGGASNTDPGPSMALKVGFVVVGVAALASTVAAVCWRLTGRLLEDALEDDVVSLGMAGLSISLGCALCVRGRQGWPILAGLLAGMVAYCVAVGLTIVLR